MFIPELPIDVLIFGGGIAGLWTLARLRQAGYSCVLLESNQLGAGQTIASQGIIHGGVKYALTGSATSASKAIAEMPAIWRACLEGRGEVDLRGVKVPSERQYLWTTTGIGSRLAGLAASKVIRTSVELLDRDARPDWLREAPRSVDVYTVDEPILDPFSLLEAFAAPHRECIVQYDAASTDWVANASGSVLRTAAPGGVPIAILPKRLVLAAGAGNGDLVAALGLTSIADEPPHVRSQRRPLHMAMVRGRLPAVFGHCVGFSDKPRITITSQADREGRTVWYIGGDIAETGVQRSREEQIAAARIEAAACLPWVDLAETQWSTLRIDRVEGTLGDARNQRPDEPLVFAAGEAILAYPTKLAFAPCLAERVLQLVRADTPPQHNDASVALGLPYPSIAPLPWNREDLTWT